MIQQGGALQGTVGGMGVHVDITIGGVALDLHVNAEVAVGVLIVGIVELGARQLQAVGATQGVVTQGLTVKGLGGDGDRQRIALLADGLTESLEIVGGVVVDALAEVDILQILIGGLGGRLLVDDIVAVALGNGHAAHPGIQGQDVAEHTRAVDIEGHGGGGAPVNPLQGGMLTLAVDHQQGPHAGLVDGGLHAVGGHISDLVGGDHMDGGVELVGVGVEDAVHTHGGDVGGGGLDRLDLGDLHHLAALGTHVHTEGLQSAAVVGDVVQGDQVGTHLSRGHREGHQLGAVDAAMRARGQVEGGVGGVLGAHGHQQGVVDLGVHLVGIGEIDVGIVGGFHRDGDFTRLAVLYGGGTVTAEAAHLLEHIHGLHRLVHDTGIPEVLPADVGLVVVGTVEEDVHTAAGGGVLGVEALPARLHVGRHGVAEVGHAVLVDEGGHLSVARRGHLINDGHGLIGHEEGTAVTVGEVALDAVGHAVGVGDALGIGSREGGSGHGLGLVHGLADVALLDAQAVAVRDQVGGELVQSSGHAHLGIGADEELLTDGGDVVARVAHGVEVVGQLGVSVGVAHHDLTGSSLGGSIHGGGSSHAELSQGAY